MRLRPVLILTLASASALAFGGVAAANTNTTLSLTSYSHMVVDGAHGHEFVTGNDGSVEVLNTNGTAHSTITGLSAASGMALSPDSSTLYVAECGQDSVHEINTTTLTDVGSFAANVGGSCDLTLAGGRLWYITGSSSGTGTLTSVSTDASHTEIASGASFDYSEIAAVPGHPTWLVVAEVDASRVLLENIADPSAVAQLAISSTTIGSELGDIAVAPNGASLVVALNSPKGTLRTLALPSLTATAVTYPMNQPRSVAISPAGGKVAAGSSNLRSSTVTVFNTGNPLALSGRGIGDGSSVIRHFVAFSANGAFLYAVTPTSTGHYAFRTLQVLPMTTAQFNLKASKPTVAYGAGVTLSVHLGVSTTNRTVSIYRQPYGSSTPVLSHTGKVGTGGNLTFVAHPITKTIYTVRWSGDATHLATTPTARTVQVSLVVHRQTKGGYSTASGIRLYHYAASCGGAAHTGCPTFQAWTSPLQPARTMTYTVQGKNTRGTWVTVLTGGFKTGAGGKLTLTITYKGTGFVGVNQRIRFKMQKSNEFVGQTSSWLPFRITT